MDLNTFILAETAPPQQGGSPLSFPVMMVLLFGVMYFMMIRPQKRREKERKEMIANVKIGDRVLLTSGIVGEVATVKETSLVIRTAEQTRLEVVKGAISQILDKDATPESVETV